MRSADETSLRRTAFRVGAQTTLAVAITVLVLGAISVLMVLRSQKSVDDDAISAALANADDVVDPPAGTWLLILHQGGVTVSPGLPPGAADEPQLSRSAAGGTSVTEDRSVKGREYRVRTDPRPGGGAAQVVLDLTRDHVQRTKLIEALMLVGAAGLLPAAGIGVWLGRRAVVPMAGVLVRQRRFVADAGHELRTPVTLLSTRAQLIQRALRTGTDVTDDVDKLVRDADHLAAILDDLLIAADPREKAAPEPVDLADVAARVTDAASAEAQAHRIRITVHSGGPTEVRGSGTSLSRAVTALVDNAVRHARSEVVLTVSTTRRRAELDISDDGPGIDPDILPSLFDRFATAPADRQTGVRRRYGLGLALVSEIAARHGGSITATNTGHGARFRLSLPAAPERSPDSGSS
ncbi:sensor histidine kinase [Amycolatopsis sp. NBC_01480]|uniref:sensor histidine kinase n=1 Tax=Amycolatopsis sp. NBC_01480 TaxID=2903562 RepID=UPI002E2B2367|nr:HAMP domain-containing sensor histidine kinase [Amycolatopsis sp. NBC_01480]